LKINVQDIVTESGQIQIESVPQYTIGKKDWAKDATGEGGEDRNIVYEIEFG